MIKAASQQSVNDVGKDEELIALVEAFQSFNRSTAVLNKAYQRLEGAAEELAKELEETNPTRPDAPRSRAEMVFLESLRHTMTLTDEARPLGLVEDLSAQRIISRTLPVELPPNYLRMSPGLSLAVGGQLADALAL